jgi:acyl-CoA thioesterase
MAIGMTDTTSYTQLLAAAETRDGRLHIDIPADWAQGRTAYGGLTAALCIEAAGLVAAELPPLRSAQFAFIGPAAGQLHATPTVLRRGKSATYIGVDLAGDDGMATRALLCFGTARPSRLTYDALPAPTVPAPEACDEFFRGGIGPAFAVHFESRLAGGARPFSPTEKPEMMLWMRHRDVGARESVSGLVALADALPAAALVLFPERAPFSTATWSVDLLVDAPHSDSGWWLLHSVADSAGNGYSTQAMTMWNDRGEAVLVARQNVVVFI